MRLRVGGSVINTGKFSAQGVVVALLGLVAFLTCSYFITRSLSSVLWTSADASRLGIPIDSVLRLRERVDAGNRAKRVKRSVDVENDEKDGDMYDYNNVKHDVNDEEEEDNNNDEDDDLPPPVKEKTQRQHSKKSPIKKD